jgi:lysophospholipase L1-like esterase
VGSLTCTLLCLEVAMRVLRIKPQTATVLSSFLDYDAETGWRGRPNAASRFATTNFDSFVTHDAEGQRRSLDTPLADDYQHRSVWVLGDSGTWGWGVDDDQTYINLLNAPSGDGRRFRNLGRSGFSTVQEYLLLRQLLAAGHRPREVLLLFCENDLFENDETSDDDPPRPHAAIRGERIEITNQPVPPHASLSVASWLKQHSLVYNHLHFHVMRCKMALSDRFNAEQKAAEVQWITGVDRDPNRSDELSFTPDRVRVLRHFYGLIRDLCHEHGIRFAVISPFRVDPALRRTCAELDVPLLDTSRHFAQFAASPEKDQPWHFPTDPHCNALGHRLLAEGIRQELNRIDSQPPGEREIATILEARRPEKRLD